MKNYSIKVTLNSGQVITEEAQGLNKNYIYQSVLLKAQDPDDINSIEVLEVEPDYSTLKVLIREHKAYSAKADGYYSEHNLDKYYEETDKARAIKDVALKLYTKQQWTRTYLSLRGEK